MPWGRSTCWVQPAGVEASAAPVEKAAAERPVTMAGVGSERAPVPSVAAPPVAAGSLLAQGPALRSVELVERVLEHAQTLRLGQRVELRFRLNPEDLGSVQVTIRADGDRLRVRLVADSAAGAEALQHGAARQQLEAGTHAATRATLEILHHNTGRSPPAAISSPGGSRSARHTIAATVRDGMTRARRPSRRRATTRRGAVRAAWIAGHEAVRCRRRQGVAARSDGPAAFRWKTSWYATCSSGCRQPGDEPCK